MLSSSLLALQKMSLGITPNVLRGYARSASRSEASSTAEGYCPPSAEPVMSLPNHLGIIVSAWPAAMREASALGVSARDLSGVAQ